VYYCWIHQTFQNVDPIQSEAYILTLPLKRQNKAQGQNRGGVDLVGNVIGILVHYRRDVLRIITESYKTIGVMQVINRNLPLRSLAAIAVLFSGC
jgi:hypothetical protein